MAGLYQTKWVQEIPPVDTMCPICNQNLLEEGQFGGVICRKCHLAWKKSKYPPKSGEEKESPRDVIIMDELKNINDRLDKLGIYLKEKLG